MDGTLFLEIIDYILPRIQQVAGTLEEHENTAAELAASLVNHSLNAQYKHNFRELMEETLKTLILFANKKIDLSQHVTRKPCDELSRFNSQKIHGNQQTYEDNEPANEEKKKKKCCVIS